MQIYKTFDPFLSSSRPSEKLNSHPLMPLSLHWRFFCSNFLVVMKNLHFPPATLFFLLFFVSLAWIRRKKRHKKYLAYLNRKKWDCSLSPLPFLLFSILFFCLLSSHLPGGDGGDCVNTEYYLKKFCGSSAAVWEYYCTLNVTWSLISKSFVWNLI